MKSFIFSLILLLISCGEGNQQQQSLSEENTRASSGGDSETIVTHELARLPEEDEDHQMAQGSQEPQPVTVEELSIRYDEMMSKEPQMTALLEYNCNKNTEAIQIKVQEYEGEPGKGQILCEYKHNGNLWYYANNQREFCKNQLKVQLQKLTENGFACEEARPTVVDNDSELQDLAKAEVNSESDSSSSEEEVSTEEDQEEEVELESIGTEENEKEPNPEENNNE